MVNSHKQAVILDTNIIFNHWFLETPYFNLLERAANLGLFEIYIPEIVLLEVKSEYQKRLKEYFKYEKIRHMIEKLDMILPSLEQIYAQYEAFLRRKMVSSSFEILPINEHINVKKLLIKSIEGRKPFKGSSEKGFKDELIWQTIVNNLLIQGYKVYFITNNTSDFCQESQLHPDLKKDLQDLGIPENNCTIYSSLKSFIDEHVFPRLERPQEFASQFIKNWILDNISFLSDKLTIQCNPFSFDIEDPELVEISYVEDVVVENVYYLDENQEKIFIHAIAEVQVIIDAFLFKSNYYCLDLNDRALISVMDEDWSDHYVWIQIYPRASLDISFILNIQTNEVISFEGILTCYNIYDFCKHCSAPLYSDAVEVCPNCGKNLF